MKANGKPTLRRPIERRFTTSPDASGQDNGSATPRRPIEREYLATLNAAVPLDIWQAICKRAADDALAGDARARDWLAKWLLGIESRVLTTLAAEESVAEPEAVVESEIEARRQTIEHNRRENEKHRQMFQSFYE